MDKVECYNRAMITVLRDEELDDNEKLEILDVLMEARNIERATTAAWSAYQADKGAQE